MGLGVGIFLIAIGAILAYAVDYTASGVDIHAVGIILLIVGIVGVVLSMIFWSSWGGLGSRRRTEITESDPEGPYVGAGRRRVVRDDRIDRY